MEYLQEKNRFYVPGAEGQDDIAEVVFSRQGDHLAIINHTYVDVNYRNQGIAEHLIELVVEEMRKEKRKIIPACRFALVMFNRDDCYKDIWYCE